MKTEPIEKEKLIERLEVEISNCQDDLDAASWAYEEGILISKREAVVLLDLAKSTPKIKQLEWDFYGTYYTASRMEYRIETPFIDCMITQGDDFNINENECLLWVDGVSYNFRTLDEAKAAAQAEFEKRVMECLEL